MDGLISYFSVFLLGCTYFGASFLLFGYYCSLVSFKFKVTRQSQFIFLLYRVLVESMFV